jgi:hypothetical protein
VLEAETRSVTHAFGNRPVTAWIDEGRFGLSRLFDPHLEEADRVTVLADEGFGHGRDTDFNAVARGSALVLRGPGSARWSMLDPVRLDTRRVTDVLEVPTHRRRVVAAPRPVGGILVAWEDAGDVRFLVLDDGLDPVGPVMGLGYLLFHIHLVATPSDIVLLGSDGSERGVSVSLGAAGDAPGRPSAIGIATSSLRSVAWDGARIVATGPQVVAELEDRGRLVSTTSSSAYRVLAAVGTEDGLLLLRNTERGELEPPTLVERETGRVLRRLVDASWPELFATHASVATSPGRAYFVAVAGTPELHLVPLEIRCD